MSDKKEAIDLHVSSDYHFRFKGERRFHNEKGSNYPLPNDDEEHLRLRYLQFVCRTAAGRNVLPPLSPSASKILDVGTGGGAWCLEVAKEYPNATVYGLDISPITCPDKPENCQFVVGNLNEGLKFDDNSFDFVHSRAIMASMTRDQWPDYMKEVYRILKPGTGWIQCGEFNPFFQCDDGSVPDTADIWTKDLKNISEGQRDHLLHGEHLESTVSRAGFVDVKVKKFEPRLGEWDNDDRTPELKRATVEAFASPIRVLVEMMTERFPSQKERKEFGAKVEAEMRNPAYHLFTHGYFVIGRKAEDGYHG